ncbi:MAG: hypothetical protein K2W93_16850 [Burkholderiaceae bacterium]|nr:hypothetical protein [Burkholderiaceae bacterium]
MIARFYDRRIAALVAALTAGVLKAQLIDLGQYTPDTSATGDQYLNAIPPAARIGAPVTLGGKSQVGRVFDATFPRFTFPAGTTIEAVVIYEDTGSEATSPLIMIDDAASGLPIGADKTYADLTSHATYKLFRL